MTPILAGYFPRRTRRRAVDAPSLPTGIDDVCNVGCGSPSPEGWVDLWLHNELWLFDSERLAWAVATDAPNMQRLGTVASERLHRLLDAKLQSLMPDPPPVNYDEWATEMMQELTLNKRGWWAAAGHESRSVIRDYLARHTVLPGELAGDCVWPEWDIYAYRVFPVRFRLGQEEPFPVPNAHVEPLPAGYESLGYDPVSREFDNQFCHSPLSPYCNGLHSQHRVNRHCLLDDPADALRLAQVFSANAAAEPGPYHVVEVLRRTARTHEAS